MSRQIQFRRGTADEHKNFTGAEGEITVDLTNKTLRVHDGVTAGGTMLARADALNGADYVVAWQTPTAENNYAWYRKYKSGWVEQGGIYSVGKLNDGAAISGAITPHIQMADNAYYVSLVPTSPANYNRLFANLGPRTNNEFYFGVRNIGGTTSDISVCWQASGFTATPVSQQ